MKKITLAILVRSCLFWLLTISSAFIYNILAWILFPLPVKIRFPIVISWAHIFVFLARYICGIKYVIYGKEHLPKTTTIIASNHQSAWETIAFSVLLPRHVWVMKQELLRIPFFGWTLSTLWPIAINRKQYRSSLQRMLTEGKKRLQAQFWLLLFPQGTRVAPNQSKPYKTGVAYLAQHLHAAVIPVSHNAGLVMPKHSFFLYPGTVTIIIDKPIHSMAHETVEHLTTRIEQAITRNLSTLTP